MRVPEHRARHGATIISKVFWGKTKASAAELENCAGWKLLGEQSIPLELHGGKKDTTRIDGRTIPIKDNSG